MSSNPALDTPTGTANHGSATYSSVGAINVLIAGFWTKGTTVASVSSTNFGSGLWVPRKSFVVTHSGETLELALWWADVSASGRVLTNEVVTPTYAGGGGGESIIVAGVNNVIDTAPWDVNAAVPATGENVAGSSTPSVNISTTNGKPLVIALVGTSLNQTLGSNPGTDFTFDLHEHASNGGPDTDLALEHYAAPNALTGYAATWGVSLNEWAMLVDVLAANPYVRRRPSQVSLNRR